jgi:hypothetical protein
MAATFGVVLENLMQNTWKFTSLLDSARTYAVPVGRQPIL